MSVFSLHNGCETAKHETRDLSTFKGAGGIQKFHVSKSRARVKTICSLVLNNY